MAITIYHNRTCGTSRTTLDLIRQTGEEPRIVEYLKTPPSRSELMRLIQAMAITPRELLRKNGAIYEEHIALKPTKSDDELIDAMVEHPELINRPIVVTARGTRLCRPAQTVLEILPDRAPR